MNTSTNQYYNLDEQFSTKSVKQVKRMMTTRKDKEQAAMDHVEKYGKYPYNEVPRYIASVKKANRVIDDCNCWMKAAFPLFSYKLWDEMIADVYGCLEGNGSDWMRGIL